jgi:dolichyl-phosphate-mannose--protein O-mannosyl transferase
MIILGITNPAVWLLTIPSMAYLAYRAVKGRIAENFSILLFFFISYTPLLLSARPIWAHTAFSVAPFVFMATSYTIRNVFHDRKTGNVLTGIYLVIVIMINIPLYALAIGKGLEHDQLRPIVEMYKPSYDWKK